MSNFQVRIFLNTKLAVTYGDHNLDNDYEEDYGRHEPYRHKQFDVGNSDGKLFSSVEVLPSDSFDRFLFLFCRLVMKI
jgi:hypothetical protein